MLLKEMDDNASDCSDNYIDFEDLLDFGSPKKRSFSDVDTLFDNHSYGLLPDAVYSTSGPNDDTTPWEIFSMDQWAQLQLLGVVSADELIPRVDSIALSGRRISASTVPLQLHTETRHLWSKELELCMNSAVGVMSSSNKSGGYFEGYRIVWPGERLPEGLTAENITSLTLDHGNKHGLDWRHVFYLEKQCQFTSDESEYQKTDAIKRDDVSYVTALCTHEGHLIPHPKHVLPFTMAYATADTIPISNIITVTYSQRSTDGSQTSTPVTLKRQFCDSRHYVEIYRQVVGKRLRDRPDLVDPLLALDREQKSHRRRSYQHKILNSVDSSSSSTISVEEAGSTPTTLENLAECIADSRKLLTPETNRTRATDGMGSMKVVYTGTDGESERKRARIDNKGITINSSTPIQVSSTREPQHNHSTVEPVLDSDPTTSPAVQDSPLFGLPKNMKEWSQLFKQSSELLSALSSMPATNRDTKKAELMQVYMALQSAGVSLGVNEVLIGHVTEKLTVLLSSR